MRHKEDQYVTKVYGYGDNKKIKIVRMNSICEGKSNGSNYRGQANEDKLSESISRTKGKIFELAFCNPWDWFFTGTLDPRRYDRTNLKKFHSDFTRWICEYNRYYGTELKYLVVPELHADGKSWHMHGLIYGLPPSHLHRFQIGDKMGGKLAEKVKNGDEVYSWQTYQKKFGFCDLEPIRSEEAVSKYMTKYITKDLGSSVTELNAHMYYHSRGLNFAEKVKSGSVWRLPENIQPDFENDYCAVYWLQYSPQTLADVIEGYI